MSGFSPASEVLLRHSDDFTESRVLFAGDMQDDLPARFDTAQSRAHTQQFHHWQVLSKPMGDNARYGLVADADIVADSDTLIYYWPKNKPEAQFQLMNLLSLLPVGTDIFVVGENRSGVRSAEAMLEAYCPLNKIDSARRCGLYHGRLEKQPEFNADGWWGEYQVDELTIKTLPGVFSRDGLDVGSDLLLSTLSPHTKGKVLDVGCGTGVLAAVLASHSPKVRLTLCDVSAPAVEASRATLAANGFEGEVIASNVFSEIKGRFDMIISNPPFHDGMETSFEAAQTLIRSAVRHLNIGGELRIVANAFLPYPNVLDETFGNHEVLAQTGRFKVYRAVMGRNAKR
ncbi:16S rRNA (guanine(1207)-N(2))-methyltransferase RsmC [Cronobacter turicensis]|jgi:16S rRNA (guanine1207-N2)-methyltransferase|uniref:Ribosomal RNA small subunit methyltransferase C n=1 Tax=Cronobacter turicensis (strain DSM 18703 / CCUG 55852 / LMG 23827 / z3032) TaxID=693216 RepID=C9XUY5_CROTZ|nr:16S rRNA (guanine(1207)-N(2))-methyltransferase RsmC [Cronobacter turicensis]MEB8539097.1 16S rRNA (guanine(1207)-N(2))-methyltransferase RsmC [Cronobacter sakazakii]CBA27754.1 Ribosomal RNA small subunit methyltransferase C [Cronobacter turicensis z3032]EGT5680966.1 16S rRNA (guanine(1207)-N(2))-methyltransferase RsmC [Cronobacter turicensis]EGT5739996.1 16S rRNA (guanine(1207)-N(2))-methyltransferase RsmC [Cronobacter turicensis]EKM0364135.1 16S rRNA (guanine(1207)-N(2))-methyltransferase